MRGAGRPGAASRHAPARRAGEGRRAGGALNRCPPCALGEISVDQRAGRDDRAHAGADRGDPRDARDVADVPVHRRGAGGGGARGRGRAPGRRGRPHHERRGGAGADRVLLAPPRPRPGSRPRAGGAAWPRRPPGRAPRRAHADRLRGLRRPQAARGGEPRLTPAAHAVARAALRYRARYATGAFCLVAATGFSLAIPWTVKHAIDALAREGAAAALGGYLGPIPAPAAAHRGTRPGPRVALLGAGQRVEADPRGQLSPPPPTLPPPAFAPPP